MALVICAVLLVTMVGMASADTAMDGVADIDDGIPAEDSFASQKIAGYLTNGVYLSTGVL